MNKTSENVLDLELLCKKPPISIDKYKKFIHEDNSYNKKKLKDPLLSILIVAYNEDDLLLRLFDSILSAKSESYEIIVVDNGLSPGTKENLKSYSLRHLVLNENVGCTAGRKGG